MLAPRMVAIVSEESNHRVLKTLRQEGKFLVAHIIGDARTGREFEKLPPHITLLPPFKEFGHVAVHGFLKASRSTELIGAHIGAREFGPVKYLGAENDIPTRPITGEGSIALLAIHMLYLANFPYSTPLGWAGHRYQPHLTIVSEELDPGEGANICVDSACLLRKMEDNDNWLVYQADKLKSE